MIATPRPITAAFVLLCTVCLLLAQPHARPLHAQDSSAQPPAAPAVLPTTGAAPSSSRVLLVTFLALLALAVAAGFIRPFITRE
jgi:hypothetical protein